MLAGAQAGKHVFCEKPFALRPADAEAMIAACRDADETPAGGMTGMGVHLTDAFISWIGPVAEVRALCVDHVLGRASGDTVAVLLRFANGATGTLTTTLKTAFIWHIRALGSEGWVESYGENEIRLCRRGGEPETRVLAPVDSVLAEIEAFAEAVEGRAPYPVPDADIVHNVAILEAVFRAAESGETVRLNS